MSLAEGVAARIAYKAHSTGVITPGTEPVLASDPGASGGQIIRRVSSSLSLSKETYQSNEVRTDRQIVDFRHGVRRVQGNISGELSPLTYADFFEAAFRGEWEASVTFDEADVTSVAADSGTSKLTFASGDPVDLGLRVGQKIRFTNLSQAANNNKDFTILSFGGTNNRELTVSPAPTTMSADTDFDMTTAGASLIIPSTDFESRKFAIEIYNSDIDVARVFSECRVSGFNVQMPPTGMSTVDFDFMGRNMTVLEGGSAPFFTSPAAETSTGLLSAVNGLLRVSGNTVAVVTGLNIQMQLSPDANPVVGSNVVPEIFLGRTNVTGQMTAFFENADLINDFINETEIEILASMSTGSAGNAAGMSFYMPRVKLGGADPQTQGEGGQSITLPFQALKYNGAAAGVPATTLQITDSEVTV